jgi:hypothetical protein
MIEQNFTIFSFFLGPPDAEHGGKELGHVAGAPPSVRGTVKFYKEINVSKRNEKFHKPRGFGN